MIGGPVDITLYRQAAQQYFEAAQQYYQAGDHARGDYCILRGDGYLLLASIATQVHSLGVAPGSDQRVTGQSAAAVKSNRRELEEKLRQLQNSREQRPPLVPNVPAEAANEDVCASYHEEELACLDHVLKALEAHDEAGQNYWLDQTHYHALQYDICQIVVKIVSSG